MTLNLSPEALLKARRLAELRHLSLEEAVEEAITDRLRASEPPGRPKVSVAEHAERLRRIQAHVRATATTPHLDDTDLYDADGNPIL
ncbi:type II toxin-antitoxin system VapB family antitoxin [Caenispirillum bisanense]|uniref:type II toxin-antitoxin system VapB family antitoxin n=1 Tax=Caenispirillum bisanense TaxID=414052 RepID=UPI0031E32CC1